MLDASRAVVVVNNLLDPNNQREYIDDVKAEYAELRAEYLDSLKDKSFVSLAKARAKRLQTDWKKVTITRPSFLGTRVFENFDLNQVLPWIDWDPFFQTW